jgi:gas vesicle protein
MKKQKTTPTDLFLAFLALMLISVSFYQTWLGLDQIFGGSSIIISLVLSLILLFLLWQIKRAKANGQSTAGLSSIYMFFAAFCFVANFNAIYTRFMETDIYRTELRNIKEKFNTLETDVLSRLGYKYNKETAQNIEIKKKQLMEQIKDPGNHGIGTRALSLIRDIEKLTGQKVDLLTPEGNNYDDLAERMGNQIDNMITDLSPEEKNLKTDINNAVLKWDKDIQDLLLESQEDINAMAQGLIDKSLSEYNKLGNRSANTLGNSKFQFTPEMPSTQEVGKVGYAFGHALSNLGIMPVLVLAACLLLDFGILFIILLMPNENNNQQSNGYKRFGRTLTSK